MRAHRLRCHACLCDGLRQSPQRARCSKHDQSKRCHGAEIRQRADEAEPEARQPVEGEQHPSQRAHVAAEEGANAGDRGVANAGGRDVVGRGGRKEHGQRVGWRRRSAEASGDGVRDTDPRAGTGGRPAKRRHSSARACGCSRLRAARIRVPSGPSCSSTALRRIRRSVPIASSSSTIRILATIGYAIANLKGINYYPW